MKSTKLIIQQNKNDVVDTNGNVIAIPSIIGDNAIQGSLSSNVSYFLKSRNLTLSEDTIDLLNLALAVYSLDQLVSRNEFGHYQWTRKFEISLPVLNIDKWNSISEDIEEALGFLSGDYWHISLSKRNEHCMESKLISTDVTFDKVCLFSGGLDSFIGAVKLLEEGDLALVGHHKKGGYEKASQQDLISSLKKAYKDRDIQDFLFYVQPSKKKEKDFKGEDTQRARSFLFLVLGVVVANTYGDNIPLYVPENGLISLNLPLTYSRQGTYSTKTTHPFFIDKFVSVMKALGINNEIINPYQFHTKGEMIKDSPREKLVIELFNKTISCSKPGYYKRWSKKGEVHCGHCIPCIIRRAALHKVGKDNPDDYVFDVKKFDTSYNKDKGADIHAFKIAIQRLIVQRKLNVFELLKSGNIPEGGINDYLELVRRGILEVDNFIKDL
ncbi:MAG: hypothetical protein N4A72_22860 [Bacteroidales bacterium]|jgi:7-cyano-7-deazaguanine synthase in queuosine biosynthesis|nr:hypothetical protein [Bacteroidales bacterium]